MYTFDLLHTFCKMYTIHVYKSHRSKVYMCAMYIREIYTCVLYIHMNCIHFAKCIQFMWMYSTRVYISSVYVAHMYTFTVMGHDSLTRVMWHDSFSRVMWHDSFTRYSDATWLTHTLQWCDMTHSHVWWDMTHSHVWYAHTFDLPIPHTIICISVDSIKLNVSFAKEPCKKDYILQKRPILLRSLLIVATP